MARISKIYRILISGLLALLGFSCGIDEPVMYGPGPAEYGMPSATYKARGVVVSEADDTPIEGIKTVLKSDWHDDYYPIASAYTNSDGSFFLAGGDFPGQKLYVKLIDVDGELNGSFAEMEVEADYTNVTFTGSSGHWYDGEAEIDLGIIKMKPENEDELE